jgi:pyruvate/2-oxoglutarate/acetoin dehydrogenase E1 component
MDIDLIELRSLKPLDMDTIKASLQRTHKVHFEAATDNTTHMHGRHVLHA